MAENCGGAIRTGRDESFNAAGAILSFALLNRSSRFVGVVVGALHLLLLFVHKHRGTLRCDAE